MTQIDLSRKTGIRPNTINDIYHESCERINLYYVDLICEALDCNIIDLIEYMPNKVKGAGTDVVCKRGKDITTINIPRHHSSGS